MDDLYISDGTSSGTVVIMDGHLYAHETQNKHSIIGSVVYHSSSDRTAPSGVIPI